MLACRFKLLTTLGIAAGAVLCVSSHSVPARAQADFYKDKTITVVVGYTAGGGYDVMTRILVKYMGSYIPGKPTMVVQNMPGAGSLKAVNFLYAAAPKDGTTFGTFGRGIPMEPLLGNKAAQFEATKFTWLGSVSSETSVCAAWHTSKIKTWDDMLKMEFTAAGEGSGSDPDIFAAIVKNVFGAKLRLVTGYPGGAEMALAVERGEVDGRCGWSWSSIKSTRPTWVPEKKLIPLIVLSLHKNPELPAVPVITEFANPQQMQILKLFFARQEMGRPFAAPPNIPNERAAALRDAFDSTMKDKAFVAEIERNKLDVLPVSGAEIERLLTDVYSSPPEIAAAAREIVSKGAR